SACDDDRPRAETVHDECRADAGAAPVELLADQRPVEAREARAAVLLRNVRVHQTEVVRLHDNVGRVRLVLVVFRRLRPDFPLGVARILENVRGPRVDEDAVEFALPDPNRTLADVALLHELRRPRRVEFARDRPRGPWRLRFKRPDADRLEYLLERTGRDGKTEIGPDPWNPARAAGPFGEKSVVEFPGYKAPEWVGDDDSAQGDLRELALE